MFLPWRGFWAVVLLIASSVAFHGSSAAQEPDATHNLLTNASFESGTDGWVLNSYGKHGSMSIDPAEKHGTLPALRIDNAEGDDTSVRQKVAVKPQTRYRISGFIKTKDAQPVHHKGKDGATLSVGNGSFEKTPAMLGNKSWLKVTHEFRTGQESEIEIGPRLGFFSGPVSGTAWFAELSLVELGKTSR